MALNLLSNVPPDYFENPENVIEFYENTESLNLVEKAKTLAEETASGVKSSVVGFFDTVGQSLAGVTSPIISGALMPIIVLAGVLVVGLYFFQKSGLGKRL